jgi:uncharacterized protein YdeI (BOF family)
MLLRQALWIALTLGVSGHVLAQQIEPTGPAAPQAATPAPPPVGAKPVESATGPAAAASTQAEDANSSLEGEIDADKIMAMQKAGYKIKNENGKILLCQQDLQTGSRLRKKTSCMTAREWEQLKTDNEMQLKALERRPRMGNQ